MLHQPTQGQPTQPCFYCSSNLDSEFIHFRVAEDYIDFCLSCSPRFISDLRFSIAYLYAELSEVKTLTEA